MRLPENFRQALTFAYRENPCQVLPNALWKSLSWAEQFETGYTIEAGRVTQLIAWDLRCLMLYWSRNRHLLDLPFANPLSIEFALLHQDFKIAINFENFEKRARFFRLNHNMEAVPRPQLPAGFSFALANPFNESQAISDLIGACYEDIYPRPETVRDWTGHPVFVADLWFWIVDEARKMPAALGIAEFDSQIAEGSLEWIQVLPEYRGKGLGQQIVYELLNRLKDRGAEFTTVAGRVDNATRPEMLYRRCGFTGDDVWWVLQH